MPDVPGHVRILHCEFVGELEGQVESSLEVGFEHDRIRPTIGARSDWGSVGAVVGASVAGAAVAGAAAVVGAAVVGSSVAGVEPSGSNRCCRASTRREQ